MSLRLMRISVCFVVLLLLSAAASTKAFPAQVGRVLSLEAPIFQKADVSSPILYKVYQGERVRISNKSKDGWYKVVLPQSQDQTSIGWVRTTDVEPDTIIRDLTTAGITITDPIPRIVEEKHFVFLGFYGTSMYTPSSVEDFIKAETKSTQLVKTWGGEVGYRISRPFTLSLRYEPYSFSGGATVLGQNHTYSVSGTMITGILDYAIYYTTPWRFGFSIGLGESVGTLIKASRVIVLPQRTEREDPRLLTENYTTSSFLIPTLLIRQTSRWYLSTYFALGVDLGYRYMRRDGIILSTSSINADFSGLFGYGLLQLEF